MRKRVRKEERKVEGLEEWGVGEEKVVEAEDESSV